MKAFVEKEKVDELREACGTLPSRARRILNYVYYGCERLEVELIDEPVNPYRAIFSMATSTWGNDAYVDKWYKTQPIDRFRVVLAALQGKTLPMGVEGPKYTFRVVGLPRHSFDQMARTRIGAAFGSIGSRDNCKLDSSFILYSEYRNKDASLKQQIITHFNEIKLLYSKIIMEGNESWQVARSFLPMCYHHPFYFNQNLLSLVMQARRRMCFAEEEFICGLHWYIRDMFKKQGLELIADAMRPACDFAKTCLYSKGDGAELFGHLFRGCGRWPAKGENKDYCEFNKSCSTAVSLEKQMNINIPSPEEYVDFKDTHASYELYLGKKDKYYFKKI